MRCVVANFCKPTPIHSPSPLIIFDASIGAPERPHQLCRAAEHLCRRLRRFCPTGTWSPRATPRGPSLVDWQKRHNEQDECMNEWINMNECMNEAWTVSEPIRINVCVQIEAERGWENLERSVFIFSISFIFFYSTTLGWARISSCWSQWRRGSNG